MPYYPLLQGFGVEFVLPAAFPVDDVLAGSVVLDGAGLFVDAASGVLDVLGDAGTGLAVVLAGGEDEDSGLFVIGGAGTAGGAETVSGLSAAGATLAVAVETGCSG